MTPSARPRSCPDTNLVNERFPQAVKLRIHRPKFYAAPLGLSLLSNPTHISRRGLNNSAPPALTLSQHHLNPSPAIRCPPELRSCATINCDQSHSCCKAR